MQNLLTSSDLMTSGESRAGHEGSQKPEISAGEGMNPRLETPLDGSDFKACCYPRLVAVSALTPFLLATACAFWNSEQ